MGVRGSKFWTLRSSHGRKPIFPDPESLWAAACEYFEWVENNPLMSAEQVKFQGDSKVVYTPKMRAMTLTGLYLFLDISEPTFKSYEQKDDFIGVTQKIRNVIYSQKFEGAAADMLNPNIISRELGLAEKTENKHDHDHGELPTFVLVSSDDMINKASNQEE